MISMKIFYEKLIIYDKFYEICNCKIKVEKKEVRMMKEELLKMMEESLSSEDVQQIVRERFSNAFEIAIDGAFQYCSEPRKALEKKIGDMQKSISPRKIRFKVRLVAYFTSSKSERFSFFKCNFFNMFATMQCTTGLA